MCSVVSGGDSGRGSMAIAIAVLVVLSSGALTVKHHSPMLA